MNEIDIGNININENIISFNDENSSDLIINANNINIKNQNNDNLLYLNGNNKLIGLGNTKPTAKLDLKNIDNNKPILKINGNDSYEELYILNKDGIDEVELLINEIDNIKLNNNTINRVNITILGVNSEGDSYVKEMIGHIKIKDNISTGLEKFEIKYLLNENQIFSERIEINENLDLKLFCKENKNLYKMVNKYKNIYFKNIINNLLIYYIYSPPDVNSSISAAFTSSLTDSTTDDTFLTGNIAFKPLLSFNLFKSHNLLF